MNKYNKLLVIGLSTALAVGVGLYITNVKKKRKICFQRQEVADEGYETAHDILFPLKSQLKKYKRNIV